MSSGIILSLCFKGCCHDVSIAIGVMWYGSAAWYAR